MSILSYAIDALMAYVFLTSALLKAHAIRDFELEIRSFHIVGTRLVPIASIAALAAELMLAILFIIGYEGYKETAALTALFIFTAMTIVRRRRTESGANCSCFGRASWLNRYPLARNAALILLVVAGYWMPARSISSEGSAGVGLAVLAAACVTWAVTYRRELGERAEHLQVLNPAIQERRLDFTLLVLSYRSPQLPEIERLLARLQGYHILLAAPEYAWRLKRLAWRSHDVIEYKAGSTPEHASLDQMNPILYVGHKGKVTRYSEVIAYMELDTQEYYPIIPHMRDLM